VCKLQLIFAPRAPVSVVYKITSVSCMFFYFYANKWWWYRTKNSKEISPEVPLSLSAGWQATLCDPIWHVSSCSDEAGCKLVAITRLLYFLPVMWSRPQVSIKAKATITTKPKATATCCRSAASARQRTADESTFTKLSSTRNLFNNGEQSPNCYSTMGNHS